MALVKKLQERYHYSLVVLKELVKTDFKLRYQDHSSVLAGLFCNR